MSTYFLYYKQNLNHLIVFFLSEYELIILSFQQIQITYASTAHPYLRICYGIHIHQHRMYVIRSGCHCDSEKVRLKVELLSL